MPLARGSARHCDAVEEHGATLASFLAAIERITSDGLVTADETRLLADHGIAVQASYRPLPGQASQQDVVFGLIGTIAHTGQVTPWVSRKIREAQEDEAYLEAA